MSVQCQIPKHRCSCKHLWICLDQWVWWLLGIGSIFWASKPASLQLPVAAQGSRIDRAHRLLHLRLNNPRPKLSHQVRRLRRQLHQIRWNSPYDLNQRRQRVVSSSAIHLFQWCQHDKWSSQENRVWSSLTIHLHSKRRLDACCLYFGIIGLKRGLRLRQDVLHTARTMQQLCKLWLLIGHRPQWWNTSLHGAHSSDKPHGPRKQLRRHRWFVLRRHFHEQNRKSCQ